MRPSNNLENRTASDTLCGVPLICKKDQVHIFLEPPLEYNQDHMHWMNQGSLLYF